MRESRGLLMAVLLLLVVWPAAAQDVFVIRDVPVDETAATADEARRTAIARAESEAWNRLVLRLVVPEQQGAAPRPSGPELDALVQSLEIADERIAADRYRALVTVRFRADAVLGLLDSAGVAHADEPSPLLLVLPVVDGPAGPVLWDETSAWLRAWQHQPGGGKVVDVVVPFADLEDILAIDAERALAGDWAAMQAAMARYQADGVVVARATESDGSLALDVDWYEGPVARDVAVEPVVVTGEESLPSAVDAVRRAVDAQWTAVSTVPEGPEATLVADVAIRGLAEWVEIRGRLERPASVLEAQPLVIGTGRVRVLLRYAGALEQLQAGLRQAGLTLAPQGDGWVILPL